MIDNVLLDVVVMIFAAVLSAQGLRNDLKAAMDKIDLQYLNEIVGNTEAGEVDKQHDLKVHEENTKIEELEVQCTGFVGKKWESLIRKRLLIR